MKFPHFSCNFTSVKFALNMFRFDEDMKKQKCRIDGNRAYGNAVRFLRRNSEEYLPNSSEPLVCRRNIKLNLLDN